MSCSLGKRCSIDEFFVWWPSCIFVAQKLLLLILCCNLHLFIGLLDFIYFASHLPNKLRFFLILLFSKAYSRCAFCIRLRYLFVNVLQNFCLVLNIAVECVHRPHYLAPILVITFRANFFKGYIRRDWSLSHILFARTFYFFYCCSILKLNGLGSQDVILFLCLLATKSGNSFLLRPLAKCCWRPLFACSWLASKTAF